jgi:hypothetical protein
VLVSRACSGTIYRRGEVDASWMRNFARPFGEKPFPGFGATSPKVLKVRACGAWSGFARQSLRRLVIAETQQPGRWERATRNMTGLPRVGKSACDDDPAFQCRWLISKSGRSCGIAMQATWRRQHDGIVRPIAKALPTMVQVGSLNTASANSVRALSCGTQGRTFSILGYLDAHFIRCRSVHDLRVHAVPRLGGATFPDR